MPCIKSNDFCCTLRPLQVASMAGGNDDKMKGAWACVTGASSGIGMSANRECAPDPGVDAANVQGRINEC